MPKGRIATTPSQQSVQITITPRLTTITGPTLAEIGTAMFQLGYLTQPNGQTQQQQSPGSNAPAALTAPVKINAEPKAGKTGKKPMSAAHRKKLSDAAKARFAKARKGTKTQAATA